MNEQNERSADDVLVYERSPSESTSQCVVAAVAAASNKRAVGSDDGTGEVLDPLYGVVDPDALDALFGAGNAGSSPFVGEVTFTYHGYLVRVGSDDRIVVARVDAAVDEPPS